MSENWGKQRAGRTAPNHSISQMLTVTVRHGVTLAAHQQCAA